MAILSLRIQDVDMKKGYRVYYKNLDWGRGEGTVEEVDGGWALVCWDDPGLDNEWVRLQDLFWIV
jgi:hypothetical protein